MIATAAVTIHLSLPEASLKVHLHDLSLRWSQLANVSHITMEIQLVLINLFGKKAIFQINLLSPH